MDAPRETEPKRYPERRPRAAPAIGLMILSGVLLLAQVAGAAGRIRQQAERRAEALAAAEVDLAAAALAAQAAEADSAASGGASDAAQAALDAQQARLSQTESLAAALVSAQQGLPLDLEQVDRWPGVWDVAQLAVGLVLFATGALLLRSARRDALARRGPQADRAR